jgi:hypothetical protein
MTLPPDDLRQAEAVTGEQMYTAWRKAMQTSVAARGHTSQPRWKDLKPWLKRVWERASENLPTVAAPPCKACGGTGKQADDENRIGGWDSPVPGPCPRCEGSGRARMVALDDVVEWLRDERKLPSEAAAIERERRFSATGEEPH